MTIQTIFAQVKQFLRMLHSTLFRDFFQTDRDG